MAKSPDAFRTISEVADWLGIQAHVLRFWESKFSHVKPVKRAGGRRYYRPADMLLLGGIKKLLHDDGMTIKGVQKLLQEQGTGHVSALSPSIDDSALSIEVEAEEINATVLQFQGNRGADAAIEPETADEPDSLGQNDAQGAAESENTTEPEPAAETAEPELASETAVLPSFLSRSSDKEEVTETNTPTTPASLPEIARAIVVDAPDPGPDDSQNYTPGSLGQLAGLDYLTAKQAEKIAPLADKLRSWLSQTDAA